MRLLSGTSDGRALTLAEHHAVHGPLPRAAGDEVLATAEAAGLRGRGGGGFPVARKLTATRAAARRGRRAVVVANGTESEPAVRKDRTLLTRSPHLVLDGLQLACRATGAREAHLALHAGGPRAVVQAALAERADDVRVRLVEVPDRYVSGEAGALARRIDGGPALPTARTVPLAVRGVGGRPTAVHNVESLACLAVAVRLGAAGYRAVGAQDEPGTLLATVRGHVRAPAVLELATGTPIGAAVAAAGGPAGELQAVLVGGFAGTWLPWPQAGEVPLSSAGLRAAGGALGAALVLALPASDCGIAASARLLRYLAEQSAGQCGPCRNGLPAMAGALDELARGGAGGTCVDRLQRWSGMVERRGACSLPDGAVGLVRSALRTFADDVERHRTGSCGRTAGDVGGRP